MFVVTAKPSWSSSDSRSAGTFSSSLGSEVQRHAVDAVAQPCRWWSVRKHVSEVPTALAAVHFDTRHPITSVRRLAERTLERIEEAGPASTALELAIGNKERLAASGARERSGPMFLQQRA